MAPLYARLQCAILKCLHWTLRVCVCHCGFVTACLCACAAASLRVHVCVRACVHVCTSVCMHARLRACVRAIERQYHHSSLTPRAKVVLLNFEQMTREQASQPAHLTLVHIEMSTTAATAQKGAAALMSGN